MADNPYIQSAKFIKSAVNPPDFPMVGLPEIAVAGRSNVGKSSLINRMCNRRRLAKVSNTPGRTQLLNFFLVNERFVLCDLPGYGYAKVPLSVRAKWGPMVERYFTERGPLRALLLLVDARREPGEWETQLITWATTTGRQLIPVITKIDKFSRSKRGLAVAKVARTLGVSKRRVIPWSSVTGDGLDQLWGTLNRMTAPVEE